MTISVQRRDGVSCWTNCAIIVLCLAGSVQAKDECAPWTWASGEHSQLKRQLATATSLLDATSSSPPTITGISSSLASSSSTGLPVTISPLLGDSNTQAGEVNCRYTTNTDDMELNYYTCTALSDKYKIPVEKFFILNPEVHRNCDNLKPNTDYCVKGFIEPKRAYDGLCGPSHGNATCLGTDLQCCNSKTWRCGDSLEDCADGTCFEGACAGDKVFTTDGDCGRDHGFKSCAGIWGDCCNATGKCGTGEAFCGVGNCQLGNCTLPEKPPPKIGGFTEDGTCGNKHNQWKCGVPFGSCCNKDGQCGNGSGDCGQGCQSAFGKCSTTSSSSSSTTTSSTTTTSSPATTTKVPTTTIPGIDSLPSCGQTCFYNMLDKHSELGCSSRDDAYCLCSNVNFNNGIRDCSNGACGESVASTVISYGSAYCSQAAATHVPTATVTDIASLPSCGRTCFHNMEGQHSQLGCPNADPYCLCGKADFGNGIRDCANGACGKVIASTVIAYESAYCSSASATPSPVAFHVKSGYHKDCTGDSHNSNDVMMYQEGICINTDCQVASLDIAAAGNCPHGQVQISYWEQANCQGKWFGYSYASRDTCRALWTDGWKFGALHLRCADPLSDCVSQRSCEVDPEPPRGICEAPPKEPTAAFTLKARSGAYCGGDVYKEVSVAHGGGTCLNTDCHVGSLDIAELGDCPDGEIRISYWGGEDCAGAWYGYGYASRNTCRTPWSGGSKFQSLWFSCAKQSDDCVSKNECTYDPEPAGSLCQKVR
ncbi:keratin-associated protein 5-5, putative [Cordyceps militaris CM01]|uniref:Keratin-associated protein 5-5, putative n=1 Tax=Cordyceps militaris (strain CM01) TaxID=983644 RepID=G3JJX2_CORMM|nr:keratin-associated protein 5-5, putative [Cordyceps militaris CM01]EGX91309.1 keratin-associated protein 5-5, putative [Cordyceps militaris CM01]